MFISVVCACVYAPYVCYRSSCRPVMEVNWGALGHASHAESIHVCIYVHACVYMCASVCHSYNNFGAAFCNNTFLTFAGKSLVW